MTFTPCHCGGNCLCLPPHILPSPTVTRCQSGIFL